MMLDQHLRALPLPAYRTDADGRIASCNDAMEELLGCRPPAGVDEFHAPWRLWLPEGRRLPAEQSPMVRARAERRGIKGDEIVVERPDGTRWSVIPYVTPQIDDTGTVVGAVTLLVDVTQYKDAERAASRLAAIVESSDDAIVAKDLEGTIMSWNAGAARLFGYTAEEAVGQPITMLLPEDRQDEEPRVLARIRSGERIDHYETVRRRKDGSLFDISITVSPVRNREGRIIGASKIGRDITDRRRSELHQRLLLDEMSHRVKNALVLAGSLVSMSARSAGSVHDLARDVRARLDALSRAHSLTLPARADREAAAERPTSLHALIRAILAPFDGDAGSRVEIRGTDTAVAPGGPVTSLALLLHEFATNAAKYGALSQPGGRIAIDCGEASGRVSMVWTEIGGPPVERAGGGPADGFGSVLARATVEGQLGGQFTREWRRDGLVIRLTADRARVAP